MELNLAAYWNYLGDFQMLIFISSPGNFNEYSKLKIISLGSILSEVFTRDEEGGRIWLIYKGANLSMCTSDFLSSMETLFLTLVQIK